MELAANFNAYFDFVVLYYAADGVGHVMGKRKNDGYFTTWSDRNLGGHAYTLGAAHRFGQHQYQLAEIRRVP